MANKLSAEQKKAADNILGRIDKCAADIQANHKSWGLDFDKAREIVNHLDRVADAFEKQVYGEDSLMHRKIELLKKAQVIQRDPDEKYMDGFKNPMQPVQVEGDEAYMSAYADDQSSAVRHGVDAAGKPLAAGG